MVNRCGIVNVRVGEELAKEIEQTRLRLTETTRRRLGETMQQMSTSEVIRTLIRIGLNHLEDAGLDG